MKTKKKASLLRRIAGLVTFFFTVNTIAWSQPAVIQTPSQRVDAVGVPNHFSIPESMGTITERHAGGQPLIIHIQDAHSSYQAQLKIRELLSLFNENGIDLIFLEGADAKRNLDGALIRRFKDRDADMKVADMLAEQGILGGAELYLADQANDGRMKAYGVEDADLYFKNIQAYRNVMLKKNISGAFLERVKLEISKKASLTFNKSLKKFFKEWMMFQDEQADILRNLGVLQETAKDSLGVDLSNGREQLNWPQLVRVIKIRRIENEVDFEAAKKESKRFMAWVESQKPGQAVLAHARAAADVLGKNKNPGDLRARLEKIYTVFSPSGFSFDHYKDLSRVWASVIIKQEIDGLSLMEEAEKLNGLILGKLAGSAEEKKIIELYRDYLLLNKLFSLEISQDEHVRLLEKQTFVSPGTMMKRLEISGPEEMQEIFNQTLIFYGLVVERDRVIYQNMADRIKSSGEKGAVLITGGFHAEGLQKKFKENGFSYLEVTPHISEISGEENYMKAMLGSDASRSQVKQPGAYLIHQGGMEVLKAQARPIHRLYSASFQTAYDSVQRTRAPALPSKQLPRRARSEVRSLTSHLAKWVNERPGQNFLQEELAAIRKAIADGHIDLKRETYGLNEWQWESVKELLMKSLSDFVARAYGPNDEGLRSYNPYERSRPGRNIESWLESGIEAKRQIYKLRLSREKREGKFYTAIEVEAEGQTKKIEFREAKPEDQIDETPEGLLELVNLMLGLDKQVIRDQNPDPKRRITIGSLTVLTGLLTASAVALYALVPLASALLPITMTLISAFLSFIMTLIAVSRPTAPVSQAQKLMKDFAKPAAAAARSEARVLSQEDAQAMTDAVLNNSVISGNIKIGKEYLKAKNKRLAATPPTLLEFLNAANLMEIRLEDIAELAKHPDDLRWLFIHLPEIRILLNRQLQGTPLPYKGLAKLLGDKLWPVFRSGKIFVRNDPDNRLQLLISAPKNPVFQRVDEEKDLRPDKMKLDLFIQTLHEEFGGAPAGAAGDFVFLPHAMTGHFQGQEIEYADLGVSQLSPVLASIRPVVEFPSLDSLQNNLWDFAFVLDNLAVIQRLIQPGYSPLSPQPYPVIILNDHYQLEATASHLFRIVQRGTENRIEFTREDVLRASGRSELRALDRSMTDPIVDVMAAHRAQIPAKFFTYTLKRKGEIKDDYNNQSTGLNTPAVYRDLMKRAGLKQILILPGRGVNDWELLKDILANLDRLVENLSLDYRFEEGIDFRIGDFHIFRTVSDNDSENHNRLIIAAHTRDREPGNPDFISLPDPVEITSLRRIGEEDITAAALNMNEDEFLDDFWEPYTDALSALREEDPNANIPWNFSIDADSFGISAHWNNESINETGRFNAGLISTALKEKNARLLIPGPLRENKLFMTEFERVLAQLPSVLDLLYAKPGVRFTGEHLSVFLAEGTHEIRFDISANPSAPDHTDLIHYLEDMENGFRRSEVRTIPEFVEKLKNLAAELKSGDSARVESAVGQMQDWTNQLAQLYLDIMRAVESNVDNKKTVLAAVEDFERLRETEAGMDAALNNAMALGQQTQNLALQGRAVAAREAVLKKVGQARKQASLSFSAVFMSPDRNFVTQVNDRIRKAIASRSELRFQTAAELTPYSSVVATARAAADGTVSLALRDQDLELYKRAINEAVPALVEEIQIDQNLLAKNLAEWVSLLQLFVQDKKLGDGKGAVLLTTEGNKDRAALLRAMVVLLPKVISLDPKSGKPLQQMIFIEDEKSNLKNEIMTNYLGAEAVGTASRVLQFIRPNTGADLPALIEREIAAQQRNDRAVAASLTLEETARLSGVFENIVRTSEDVSEIQGFTEPGKLAQLAAAYLSRALLLIDLAAYLGLNAGELKTQQEISAAIRVFFSTRVPDAGVKVNEDGSFMFPLKSMIEQLNVWKAGARLVEQSA